MDRLENQPEGGEEQGSLVDSNRTGVESSQKLQNCNGGIVDDKSSLIKSFRKILPAELRLKIYELLATEPCYVWLTQDFKCERIWPCPVHPIPGFLQVNYEIRNQLGPYYQKLNGFQYSRSDRFPRHNGQPVKRFYNPGSTVFIIPSLRPNNLWPATQSQGPDLSKIEIIAHDGSSYLKDCLRDPTTRKYSSAERERVEAYRYFPNLKKIIFIENFRSCYDVYERSTGQETLKFWPVGKEDLMGAWRQKRGTKQLTEDYQKHFPERQVPACQMMYMYTDDHFR